MQTWLAYAFDKPAGRERVARSLARVERHYESVSESSLVRSGWADERLGAITWNAAGSPCRWPSWTAQGAVAVASFHAPLSYRILTPSLSPADAPVPFARTLLAAPGRLAELSPPFALAVHDRDDESLTVLVDGLGFARIYEQRFVDGWVWSNRLGALSVFAGVPPRPDLRGWRLMAASGWFMGDSTALEGAGVLSPGAVIRVSVRGDTTVRTDHLVDCTRRWVEPRRSPGDSAELAAQSLVDTARAVREMWSSPPVVQLTGGRDSRMVAAGVVAAGIDASFMTIASLGDELAVAQRLLEALPRDHQHDVQIPQDVSAGGSLEVRAARLHAEHDGMVGHGRLRGSLAAGMAASTPSVGASLSGGGGEAVRGSFYRTTLERIDKDPSYVFRRLDGLYRVHGGVVEEAHALVSGQIARVLDDGRSIGVVGASLLDRFYLMERLRRWANTPLVPGSIAPLVNPHVLRAGFDLAPRDRIADALPTRVSELLAPQWRDVPYYKATREDFRSMKRPRSWATADASSLHDLVRDADRWGDVFDGPAVRALWSEAMAGEGLNKHESVLDRLAFRATFDEHLAVLAAAATWEPPPAALGAPA